MEEKTVSFGFVRSGFCLPGLRDTLSQDELLVAERAGIALATAGFKPNYVGYGPSARCIQTACAMTFATQGYAQPISATPAFGSLELFAAMMSPDGTAEFAKQIGCFPALCCKHSKEDVDSWAGAALSAVENIAMQVVPNSKILLGLESPIAELLIYAMNDFSSERLDPKYQNILELDTVIVRGFLTHGSPWQFNIVRMLHAPSRTRVAALA